MKFVVKSQQERVYMNIKGKDPELPILHYSCLNHVLDLYNKTEHKFVVISNY